MKKKDNISDRTPRQPGLHGGKAARHMGKDLQGYPLYPSSEDIYNKYQEVPDVNPEDISNTREILDRDALFNEPDLNDNASGTDLDIPGSELDDEQEIIGSEDEENNYYSLGGDDHNDLEEDNGD